MPSGIYHRMPRKGITVEDRFWRNVKKGGAEDCWEWLGGLNHNGYGYFWEGQRFVKPHRYSYEMVKGEIPGGLQLDHLCRNRKCVNPKHLEAVTPKVNANRGDTGKHQRIKTHCPRGHEYNEINTNYSAASGRICRVCGRLPFRKSRRKVDV